MEFISNFQNKKKKDKILEFKKKKMNFQNQEVSNHLSKAWQKKKKKIRARKATLHISKLFYLSLISLLKSYDNTHALEELL